VQPEDDEPVYGFAASVTCAPYVSDELETGEYERLYDAALALHSNTRKHSR
jgi:hypothetical protein